MDFAKQKWHNGSVSAGPWFRSWKTRTGPSFESIVDYFQAVGTELDMEVSAVNKEFAITRAVLAHDSDKR